MPNICQFQLLEYEDLLLFFVMYDSRVFCYVGWTNEAFDDFFFDDFTDPNDYLQP